MSGRIKSRQNKGLTRFQIWIQLLDFWRMTVTIETDMDINTKLESWKPTVTRSLIPLIVDCFTYLNFI